MLLPEIPMESLICLILNADAINKTPHLDVKGKKDCWRGTNIKT